MKLYPWLLVSALYVSTAFATTCTNSGPFVNCDDGTSCTTSGPFTNCSDGNSCTTSGPFTNCSDGNSCTTSGPFTNCTDGTNCTTSGPFTNCEPKEGSVNRLHLAVPAQTAAPMSSHGLPGSHLDCATDVSCSYIGAEGDASACSIDAQSAGYFNYCFDSIQCYGCN